MDIITLIKALVSGLVDAEEDFLKHLDTFSMFEESVRILTNQMAPDFIGMTFSNADSLIRESGIRKRNYTVQRRRQRTLISSVEDVTFTHTLYKDQEGKTRRLLDELIRQNLRDKGPDLKISNDHELAEYIENKIAKDGYSPGAVLGEIKAKGLEFETTISKPTLYSYIDKGIFLTITNKDLPVKGIRRKKNKKVRTQAKAAAGDSIEKRPDAIDSREEFGHWEMDTVVGKKGESQRSLLVLTERKTRDEIVVLLFEHTMQAVVGVLDCIEKKWGDLFPEVFKTITVDNGTEFSDCKGIEKSILTDGNRTKAYYCHSYSSYERGSNENQNRLVRRKIPKGTNFDDKSIGDIQEVEDWINSYPREMFGWRTAAEMFQEELDKLAA